MKGVPRCGDGLIVCANSEGATAVQSTRARMLPMKKETKVNSPVSLWAHNELLAFKGAQVGIEICSDSLDRNPAWLFDLKLTLVQVPGSIASACSISRPHGATTHNVNRLPRSPSPPRKCPSDTNYLVPYHPPLLPHEQHLPTHHHSEQNAHFVQLTAFRQPRP